MSAFEFQNLTARAYLMGAAYAHESGHIEPLDAPLSGEWADAPTGNDVLASLSLDPYTMADEDATEILDSWEAGYEAALGA